MIPEKWFVLRGSSNFKKFNELGNIYWKQLGKTFLSDNFYKEDLRYIYWNGKSQRAESSTSVPPGKDYEEITLEEFEQLVNGNIVTDTYDII